MSFYDADGFDEHDYPAPSGGLVVLDVYDDEADDDFDPTDPVGLKTIAAERVAAELADIAWCNKYGWPAGGA